MTQRVAALTSSLFIATVLSACANYWPLNKSSVPEALKVPAGYGLITEAKATGVQIYECAASADDPKRFDWVFKAPEAELFDRAGIKVGKHYAGPTWESFDGARIVGEVKAKDAGPDPHAIAWLLLKTKSSWGAGSFSRTEYVQRIKTVGGQAPAANCRPEQARQVVKVPYEATYAFYGRV